MKIFLADIEYVYCEGNVDFVTLEGGSVFAFTNAFDVRDAILKIEQYLTILKLKAVSFDAVFPYTGNSADDEKTEQCFIALGDLARKRNSVEFGEFYAYKRKNGTSNQR